MEIGKIIVISYVYRHWKRLSWFTRTLYMLIIFVLVFLTSLEIIGFLSRSHIGLTRELRINENAVQSLEKEFEIIETQISTYGARISRIEVFHEISV